MPFAAASVLGETIDVGLGVGETGNGKRMLLWSVQSAFPSTEVVSLRRLSCWRNPSFSRVAVDGIAGKPARGQPCSLVDCRPSFADEGGKGCRQLSDCNGDGHRGRTV